MYIEGILETRTWQDQSGQVRYSSVGVLRPYAGELTFLERRDGGGGVGILGGGGGGGQTGYDDRGGDSYGGSSGGGAPSPAPSRDLDDEIPF